MVQWKREAPVILLGVALAAAAALLFAFGWNLTYFQDTWAFLLERQGGSLDTFLRPHNEHLVVIPVAITKACIAIFGMENPRAETLVMIATLLAAAVLLFIYVGRRLGEWVALFVTLPVLFLGSAWMILLWPFQVEFSGAVAAGIASLLALEREDRRGDAIAATLLVLSLGFGSIGLSFLVAAAVHVFQRRRSRGVARAYVVLIPAGLFLAWYLGWGHEAQSNLTLHNVLVTPRYVFEGFASVVGSLLGFNTAVGAGTGEPDWGRPLLIALIAAVILFKWKRPGIPSSFWPTALAGLSYWVLAGVNYIPGREAPSNRYVYAGAFFLLLMLADLFRGERPGRRTLLVAAGISVLAVAPNVAQLKEGADVLDLQSQLTRVDTGALEIARETVPDEFGLNAENSGTAANVPIIAGPYFEAVDAHGSPAASEAEMLATAGPFRHWADILLSQALPLTLSSRDTAPFPGPREDCTELSPQVAEVDLGPGSAQIRVPPGSPPRTVMLRRFADGEYPVVLGSVEAGAAAVLDVPRDRSTLPWRLHVEPGDGALVCRG